MSISRSPSLAAITFLSVSGAFALGVADVSSFVRIAGFICIAAAASAVAYFLQNRSDASSAETEMPVDLNEEIAEVLSDREAALASSLRTNDTFRLIVSRLRSVTNFRGAALWLPDGDEGYIRSVAADGDLRQAFAERRSEVGSGLAGRAWANLRVETGFESDEQLPSLAVPVMRSGDAIAVLQFMFEPSYDLARLDRSVFETISSAAAPILSASLAFQKNSENALLDDLTGLPNERAFFLMLEQHTAESQRRGADRPLTVLAVSVRDFDGIVLAYGAAAGDRVLSSVAAELKDLLRSMDTITRASGDEFLIVLPTATREISADIVARIHSVFLTRKFEVTQGEKLEIKLNVGLAHFGDDGDTPSTLLQSARRSRESRRNLPPARVIDFPQHTSG
jgi:diguanylate cyclase (GGDEF)-like protein